MSEIVRLGDICHTTSGGTPSRSRQDFFGGNIPWVKSGNLNDGVVREVDEYITQAGLESSSAKMFASGTLLIAMYGATVGKLGILGIGAATNQAVCGIQPDSRLDRDFLFHFLLHRREALVAKSVGGAQPNISQAIIRDTLLPLPPLDEQRRIVGLLDRAAEIRRRTDAARSRARAIIPALFLDTFGDPATLLERYLVAEMDQIISDKQLGLVRSTREQPEDGTYGYVRMNSITTDGRVVLGDLRRTNASEYEVAVNELRDGDLLFNTRNSIELVGKMGIYRGPAGNLFNNNIMRIRLSDKLIPEFVNAYFQCPEGRAAIEAIKKGTTSVCAVYYKDLARVRLPVPPLPLQTAFAEQAQRLESLARALDAACAKAEAMAAALSAEMFGQGQAYRRHQPRLRGASGGASATMVG